MSKTWVYSDPHFYHNNICRFTNYDGTKIRPWEDANQMTEDMIDFYNEIVSDKDRVYILGDVAFTIKNIVSSAARLKGRKVLVPGNHDPNKLKKYIDVFDDVRGYVVKKGFIMSHIPIHEQSLSRWRLNIHGHLHNNCIYTDESGQKVEDSRYFCACVERTNFRPILLDQILDERKIRG